MKKTSICAYSQSLKIIKKELAESVSSFLKPQEKKW
jgi:hypothetical protein